MTELEEVKESIDQIKAKIDQVESELTRPGTARYHQLLEQKIQLEHVLTDLYVQYNYWRRESFSPKGCTIHRKYPYY